MNPFAIAHRASPKFTHCLSSLLVGAIVVTSACSGAYAQPQSARVTITIGTGSQAGVYYPTGQAICAAVNKRTKEHGIHCKAQSSNGSVENAYKLRNGTLDFALLQSDVLFFAVKGYDAFKRQGPDKNLRSVLSLFTESFTVVARPDAQIKSFDDILHKRINIGNPGSGQRASMDLVMLAKKIKKTDFADIKEYASDKQADALCANEIDAFIFTSGHPNPSITKATKECGGVIVPLPGNLIKHLSSRLPFIKPATVSGGIYPGTDWSIPSFGMTAMLVTSTKIPHTIVTEVVKSIYTDFAQLRMGHPAFAYVSPTSMATQNVPTPHHKGALYYFRDNGYLDTKRQNKP